MGSRSTQSRTADRTMTPEMWTVILTGISLAGLILFTGRRVNQLSDDVTSLRERTGIVEAKLDIVIDGLNIKMAPKE